MNRSLAVPMVSVFLAWPVVAAQDSSSVEYATKIVCGSPPAHRRAVARGSYFTAINVHNPDSGTVSFRFKIATTASNMSPGRISQFQTARLTADQALEIDCRDIRGLAPPRAADSGFVKGFVVLQSPRELDVVAVYTAAGSTGRVESIDVERVPARRSRPTACADLVVDSLFQPIRPTTGVGSRIPAQIRNVGGSAAPATVAQLLDPSTPDPSSGGPTTATTATPALAVGAAAIVVFSLPYWIYNPDATYEVVADYGNAVGECREDNNTRKFPP